MVVRRLGVLTACVLGLALLVGVVQAGAAGSTQVLKFRNGKTSFMGVGFDANNPNAIPPIGGQFVIRIRLVNAAPQFGKPVGAIVGRVLLDCTILSVDTPNGDGVCSGIAHVPNGYFTFGGNGAFNNAKVNYYAITGGVAAYAPAA